MHRLNDNDYTLFQKLVALNQDALLETMKFYLRKHYKTTYYTKEYLYAPGDIPIALVAHLDTVFPIPPEDIYYDREKNVIWSPQGLGADDRAGVFAIIKIIRSGLKPHIIFTTDEEIGGAGAKKFVQDFISPMGDMKYLIQLDRAGTNDCVFYNCINEEFIDYVESFGFIERFGTFSDISIICPAWRIAGVNLSIGYFDEHSISETFHINPFLATIDKTINMLKDSPNASYFKYIQAKYKYSSIPQFPTEVDNWVNCVNCDKVFLESETFAVKTLDGKTKFYCLDCVANKVNWCDYCGEAFEIDPLDPQKTLCKDCEKVIYG